MAKQRILAEWCYEWEPREDGEFDRDDQKYATQVCATEEEAAELADKNDIHEEGYIVYEEYLPLDYGIYQWQEVDRESTADWRERKVKNA